MDAWNSNWNSYYMCYFNITINMERNAVDLGLRCGNYIKEE